MTLQESARWSALAAILAEIVSPRGDKLVPFAQPDASGAGKFFQNLPWQGAEGTDLVLGDLTTLNAGLAVVPVSRKTSAGGFFARQIPWGGSSTIATADARDEMKSFMQTATEQAVASSRSHAPQALSIPAMPAHSAGEYFRSLTWQRQDADLSSHS